MVLALVPEAPLVATAAQIVKQLWAGNGKPPRSFLTGIQKHLRDFREEGFARSVPHGEWPQLGWLRTTSEKSEPNTPAPIAVTPPVTTRKKLSLKSKGPAVGWSGMQAKVLALVPSAPASAKPPEFKRIVVHSMSRLFRDEMLYEFYRRKLEKNGVQIVSITQDYGEGPAGDLTRRIMALTDEMNSVENAKHVQRAMQENARQNFWNGSVPPLGYRAVVAEMRGQKQKKRLEIDPESSETVRLIFRLYLEGDGSSGPLGIKNIVKYLNAHGLKTPKNKAFHISYVDKRLKDETYAGRAFYNVRDTRLKIDRPRNEWITVTVPSIITEEDFQRVQALLTLRNPRITAPRLINSNVLLTGLVICGGCGTPMLRASGKAGKYHYYRCSRFKRTGVCNGKTPQAISATLLDEIVLAQLSEHLLTPERVQITVAKVAAKREAGTEQAVINLRQLREQRGKSSKKLLNLIDLLSEGTVTASDAFKAMLKATEADVVRIGNLIAVQERIVSSVTTSVSLEDAAAFSVSFREKLTTCAPALKKRLIRSFVKHVIVTDDEIAIIGADADLAEVVTGNIGK